MSGWVRSLLKCFLTRTVAALERAGCRRGVRRSSDRVAGRQHYTQSILTLWWKKRICIKLLSSSSATQADCSASHWRRPRKQLGPGVEWDLKEGVCLLGLQHSVPFLCYKWWTNCYLLPLTMIWTHGLLKLPQAGRFSLNSCVSIMNFYIPSVYLLRNAGWGDGVGSWQCVRTLEPGNENSCWS